MAYLGGPQIIYINPEADCQAQLPAPAILADAAPALLAAEAPALLAAEAAAPAALLAPSPALLAAEAAPAALLAAPAAPAELPLPALPPVNALCWAPPPVAPGVNTAEVVQLPDELRVIETQDADEQVVVRENNNSTTFNKTIVTQVNRNHLHTQRIVTNENQLNTYVTNNVVKVNDIHSQRVEAVPGERRVFNDFKASQVVEPAQCLRAADGVLAPCAARAASARLL